MHSIQFFRCVYNRKNCCHSGLSAMPCDIRPIRRIPFFSESPTTIQKRWKAKSNDYRENCLTRALTRQSNYCFLKTKPAFPGRHRGACYELFLKACFNHTFVFPAYRYVHQLLIGHKMHRRVNACLIIFLNF